jgi:hypothetical protein
MSGFSNPIIGGSGSLVYPSIHSPNYVAGTSGWSIDKNGDAQFNEITFISGATFTDQGGNLVLEASGGIELDSNNGDSNVTIGSGDVNWTDPGGNTWYFAQQCAYLNSTFNVTSASYASIGLVIGLIPGVYKLQAKYFTTNSSVSGVTSTPGFTLGSNLMLTGCMLNQVSWLTNGQNTSPTQTNIQDVSTLTGFMTSPPSSGTSRDGWTEIDGIISVGGTSNGDFLTATYLTSTAGDQTHIMPGSFLEAKRIG